MAVTKSRPLSLRKLLPAPATEVWGVGLRYVGGGSDKEYRITVAGSRTLFQYGKRYEPGSLNAKTWDSPEQATREALKQWGAKEKQYWPFTGLIAGGDPDLDAALYEPGAGIREVRNWITQAQDRHVAAAAEAGSGSQLWLVQAAESGEWKCREKNTALTRLAHAGRTLNRDASVTSGQYLTLAVDEAAAAAVTAICPIAVRLGERTDENVAALAEIAHTLWNDNTSGSSRRALDEAIDAARAVLFI
jgi:hypothetical protein